MNVQNRRILVTRPVGQADFLLHSLSNLGANPVHLPLLAIESLSALNDAEKIRQARTLVQELDNFSKIIFISTNAVHYGTELIENFWPQLPPGIEWYGIGSATQLALQQCDITPHDIHGELANNPIANNTMTSESLLNLPAFANLQQQRILIVQGDGGRELLARVMRQRGAKVDNLVCYRRRVPADLINKWQTVSNMSLDVVLISSGEGLQNWLKLPDIDRFSNRLMIAPSERVAEQARAAGFSLVITAENASDRAMLKALQSA